MEERLEGKVAVVTGASRGGGRGIAAVLGERRATVYVTGRSVRGDTTQGRPETIDETAELVSARGGTGIAVRCDHTVDEQVAALIERVGAEQESLDILVNNAWGGYELSVDNDPFWKLPAEAWDLMLIAGVRSHMVTTRFAVPLMLSAERGLIVNTTSPIWKKYIGNVFYDVSKTAINRMGVGMAVDLKPHGIAVVTVAPGWMRTERVLEAFGVGAEDWESVAELEQTESTQYLGRAVAALATDPDVMEKSGKRYEVGELAREYGFTDIDGRRVAPFTELFGETSEE